MAYKISGTKTETGRIIVVDESDFSVEKTVLIEGSGDYEVEVTEGKKTILARSASGETIGWGNIDPTEMLEMLFSDPDIFNNNDTRDTSVTILTDTKAIVCYRDQGDDALGKACILDIDGATITVGNECIFNNRTIVGTAVTRLTDTKAIVCYCDNNDSGKACILDIDGSTITAGNGRIFNSGSTSSISVTSLTATKAIVCYQDLDSNRYGAVCVLDISGSTITAGNERFFNYNRTTFSTVTRLADTKAIVCYDDNYSSGAARVLDISDSTVTVGNEVVFSNGGIVFYTVVTNLTDTKVIVCYRDGGNNDYGTACVLDIDGSTITAGNEVVFNSSYTRYQSITGLTDTRVIVCYRDGNTGGYGIARVLNISGTTITVGDGVVFNNTASFIAVTKVTTTSAVVCYNGSTKLISNIH